MKVVFSNRKHGNELLSILLKSSKYVTADTLIQQLHISRRSLFYLISKVNEELDESAEYPITNVKNLGYYLPTETIKFLKQPSNMQPETQIPSNNSHQRQILMGFYLLDNTGCSLMKLTTKFGVARNTVIRDTKVIQDDFKTYHLTISNTRRGKVVTGSQINLRKWVYDHAKQLYSLIWNHKVVSVSEEMIANQIKLFQRITGKYLTDDATTTLSLFLFWYLNRIQLPEFQLKTNKKVKSSLNLDFTWANSFLRDCTIKNDVEADYLVKLLNSSQFSHVNWQDPLIKDLKPFAVRMITDFNHLSGAHVSPKVIADSLTVHLVSTYYRTKYSMPFEYPDLKSIKSQYSKTFEITTTVVKPFEKLMHHSLSEDEIALITIYFGGAIREQKSNQNDHDEVLVVCSSGIGTSRLLLRQLESRYRGIHFSSPMNILQYENSNLDRVRLIVSTIQLKPRNDIPITTVSALPSKLEWKIIDDAIIQAGLATSKDLQLFNVDTLLDIVENYARITNPVKLKSALSDYLNQITQTPLITKEQENISEFTKLLPPEHIGYLSHQTDWKHAVRSALTPLLDDYTVEKNYINQIIDLTIKNGPYMVVGSEIMLAHAAPRDGVNTLGATFFLLDHPVLITGKKPVKLIIGLAPIDQDKHLKFITELMNNIQNESWLTDLFKITNRSDLISYLASSK